MGRLRVPETAEEIARLQRRVVSLEAYVDELERRLGIDAETVKRQERDDAEWRSRMSNQHEGHFCGDCGYGLPWCTCIDDD